MVDQTTTRIQSGTGGGSISRKMKAFLFLVAGLLGLAKAVEHTARAFEAKLDGYAVYLDKAQSVVDLEPVEPAAGGDRAQLGLGTILAAFVVVIATFVVLIVVDEFDESVGTPSSSALSGSQSDILSGFASMTSLIEPLLLIAIGVVIIGLIRRVQ